MISEKDDVLVFNTEDSLKTTITEELLLNVVGETHPMLKEVMPEFDFNKPVMNPNKLASSLVETCKKYHGYGLSANQCGIRARVFVMGTNDDYVAFFNPKLLKYEGECHLPEGCISFPLLGLHITRPKKIEVEYQDFNGEKRTTILDGISARCFLHELDHMNGVLYTERAKPMALASGLKKREKMLKKVLKVNGNTNTIRR